LEEREVFPIWPAGEASPRRGEERRGERKRTGDEMVFLVVAFPS
jgi:hypothetical protein